MRRALLLAVLVGAAACASPPPAPAGTLLSLAGLHPFAAGDDGAWAAPGFDDSRWRRVAVPASWESLGLAPAGGVGWYRLRFSLPREPHPPLGLLLGMVGNSEEVFLDGVRLGRTGSPGADFVEAPHTLRVYPLPPLPLGPSTHVLAVRVRATLGPSGLLGPQMLVGPWAALALYKMRIEGPWRTRELLEIALCIAAALSGLLLWLLSRHQRAYLLLSSFFLLCALILTLESLLFFDTGLKTARVQLLCYALETLAPALALLLTAEFLKDGLCARRSLLFAGAGGAALTVAVTLAPERISFPPLHWVSVLYFVGCGALLLRISICASRRGVPESGPWLLGVLALAGCAVADSADHLS